MDQWNTGGPGPQNGATNQPASAPTPTALAPTAPITPTSLSDAGDAIKEGLQQAQQQARDTMDTARRQATDQVNTQVNRGLAQTSDGLSAISEAAGQASQRLRERDQGTLADYVDLATGRIDQAAGYLRRSNLSDLISDTERLVERQPALFIAGAFALGVLGARFLKSTTHHDGRP